MLLLNRKHRKIEASKNYDTENIKGKLGNIQISCRLPLLS